MRFAIVLTVLLTISGCAEPSGSTGGFPSHRSDAAAYLTEPNSDGESQMVTTASSNAFEKANLPEDFAPVQEPYKEPTESLELNFDSADESKKK